MSRFKDLTGKKFGILTVIEQAGKSPKGNYMWLCQCECGNQKVINSSNLLYGHTKSCGCLRITSNTKHGCCNDRLYKIYYEIIDRCFNSNNKCYSSYGGRGIIMCDEWKNDYLKFEKWSIENGYKQGLSIDRIDNDKGYNPDNCRGTNNKVQARNRRNNVFITCNNETCCISEWAEKLNLSRNTVYTWYKKGIAEQKIKQAKEGE